MEQIKNIHLIKEKVSPFDERDFKYIESLRYYIDFNTEYDLISCLEIDLVLEPKDQKKRYKVVMKFIDVHALDVNGFGGKYNQIMGFEIVDNKGSQLGKNQRFLIRDYENGRLQFYCGTIEVISVDQL